MPARARIPLVVAIVLFHLAPLPGCGGGDDGGTPACGTCGPGMECGADGLCVCIPNASKWCDGHGTIRWKDGCGNLGDVFTECASGKCYGGECVAAPERVAKWCDGKGTIWWVDAAGERVEAITHCTSGQCQDDACVPCVPDCEERICGDDGCGGSCGTCNPGRGCTGAGKCIDCPASCEGIDCAPVGCPIACGKCANGRACIDGRCVCTPDCTGRECGDDGCGGSCGTCASGKTCNDGVCACTFTCEGRTCGQDSCGNVCGSCAEGQVCDGGQCCTPSCESKVCGDDGCGGSCGMCADDLECDAGECRRPCFQSFSFDSGTCPADTTCCRGSTGYDCCTANQRCKSWDDLSPMSGMPTFTVCLDPDESLCGKYNAKAVCTSGRACCSAVSYTFWPEESDAWCCPIGDTCCGTGDIWRIEPMCCGAEEFCANAFYLPTCCKKDLEFWCDQSGTSNDAFHVCCPIGWDCIDDRCAEPCAADEQRCTDPYYSLAWCCPVESTCCSFWNTCCGPGEACVEGACVPQAP